LPAFCGESDAVPPGGLIMLDRASVWMEGLARSCPMGELVLDRELRCVAVNDSFAQLTGLPREAHLGRALSELFPDMPAGLPARLSEVLATGAPIHDGEILVTRAGQPSRTLLATCCRVEGPPGEVGVGVVAVDITARKRAEERLRLLLEAKELISTTLEYDVILDRLVHLVTTRLASYCAVDVLDEAGQLQLAAVGHRDPEKVAMVRELRAHFPPRESDTAGALPVTRTGQAQRFPEIEDALMVAAARSEEHLRIMRALGLRSSMIVPMRTPRGTIGAVTFVSTDPARRYEEDDLALAQAIADRAALAIDNARLHAAERRARLEAEQANLHKDEFLSVVSHELRTPLNAVIGWATLLAANTHDPARVARGLAVIERNGRQQVKIIEDILDASRIVSGKLAIDRSRLDPEAVLRAAIEATRLAAQAQGVGLELRVQVGLPAVLGDADRLQQVFGNLLGNAVKFTPRGGRVQAALSADGGEVRLEVTDTGAGIEPADLPRIFDRFWQADSSRTRRHMGLGLGLSIVKHLVDLHGGRVSAASEGAGKGARFTVTLPAAAEIAAEAPPARAGEEEVAPGSIDRVRVLVVDDEPDAREVVAAILGSSGAVVHAVGSAGAAIEALGEFAPDVLLSDLGMPGEDGFALLRRVRSLPSPHAGVAAIALTAFARDEDAKRAIAAGFCAHVPKPIEPARVIAAIARAMGRTAA
jgi:PAS domain S-box-containing protein